MIKKPIDNCYSLNADNDNWMEITPFMDNSCTEVELQFWNYVSNNTETHTLKIPREKFTIENLLDVIKMFENDGMNKIFNYLQNLV